MVKTFFKKALGSWFTYNPPVMLFLTYYSTFGKNDFFFNSKNAKINIFFLNLVITPVSPNNFELNFLSHYTPQLLCINLNISRHALYSSSAK